PGIHRLRDHRLDGGHVGDRRTVGDRLASGLANLARDGLGAFARAAGAVGCAAKVVDEHLGASRGQRKRMLATQSPAGSRHDGDPALESNPHVYPLVIWYFREVKHRNASRRQAKMTSSLADFRRETRAWLEANCPPEMRQPIADDSDRCWGGRNWKFKSEAQRLWLERMAERGWTAPTWPREYGGGGLSVAEAGVLASEMRALGCRSPLDSFGIWMLGPALLKYGTEEQKQEHLPKIVRGEIRWCQGYSEPNSGSDLASLNTRAEDAGDHFVVNGQKIWTSYANHADWIFCLVRTDTGAKKHTGISFLLFDMASPGVSTRPIVLISGKSPFCETFFDNVRVPKGNLVGELNRGWDVAKYL